MSDPNPQEKKSFSPDWLVQGVLTKLGDTFDRLTGRGWKPSSSLATSELIERMKKLLDSELREIPEEGKFVPHNLKLKMQWDKFSTDSDDAIGKLTNELLTAAVDHINDNLYHTYAPIKLEIKPDYFIQGVKLFASFGEFAEEEHEAELNVTVPGMNVAGLIPEGAAIEASGEEAYVLSFETPAGPKSVRLTFALNDRKSIGRAGSNDVSIDDQSVSKLHASLVLNSERQLMIADTGSTNGTFVNGERISYGKAYEIAEGSAVRFGTVDVKIQHEVKPGPVSEPEEDVHQAETIAIGEFEFRRKISEPDNSAAKEPPPEETNKDVSVEDVSAIPKPDHLTKSFSKTPDHPVAKTPSLENPEVVPTSSEMDGTDESR